MHRRELLGTLGVLGLGGVASACAGAAGGAPRGASPRALPPLPQRQPGRSEVVMLGVLHGAHLTSRTFSLALIERTLRLISPDVVLTELPPDRFEAILAELDALSPDVTREQIRDAWVRFFPEIYRVLVPRCRELGYELVPVSGWRPEVSTDRAAYERAHPDGPDTETYRDASAAFAAARREHQASEDPLWVNGPEYRELSGREQQALSDGAGDALGAAAVLRINQAHWQHVRTAIEARPGQRILLVYGAAHRWFMQPRLAQLAGVTLLDVRPFLEHALAAGRPAAGAGG